MFHTIFYVPLYNALIGLTGVFWGSVGAAVVVLTLIVKLILAPLSHRSIISQIEQKKLQPLVEDLKKKYPDQKEQSQKMMDLYKEHKTSPFAGCLLLIIQLPIIIALYRVFLSGAVLNPADLYRFIPQPAVIHTMFLGIDMHGRSIVLAVLAALSQFLQMHWSPSMQPTHHGALAVKEGAGKDVQGDMMASMQKSMKYTMPIMIGFFGFAVPGAVALYWVISNVFMILQERYVVRIFKKREQKNA